MCYRKRSESCSGYEDWRFRNRNSSEIVVGKLKRSLGRLLWKYVPPLEGSCEQFIYNTHVWGSCKAYVMKISKIFTHVKIWMRQNYVTLLVRNKHTVTQRTWYV